MKAMPRAPGRSFSLDSLYGIVFVSGQTPSEVVGHLQILATKAGVRCLELLPTSK